MLWGKGCRVKNIDKTVLNKLKLVYTECKILLYIDCYIRTKDEDLLVEQLKNVGLCTMDKKDNKTIVHVQHPNEKKLIF